MSWSPDYWVGRLGEILSQEILPWFPLLGAALLLLVLGWTVARSVQALLQGALRRLGIDRLGEKAGVASALQELGLEGSVSRLTARLIYWLVLLVFVLAAAESLGLEGVTQTLHGLVAYLPRVLAAALILLLGGLIARLVGSTLGALAEKSGVHGGLVLGQLTRYVILAFTAVLALEQLGVETTLLVTTATALVAALLLTLAIAFGWGSRELARNVMAGFHVREAFVVGQRLQVGERTGILVGIGPVKSLLETGEGTVSLPNALLLEMEVIIAPQETEGDKGERGGKGAGSDG